MSVALFLHECVLKAPSVSIALVIGLCLAAAGVHLFLSVKGWISQKKEDMSECLAF